MKINLWIQIAVVSFSAGLIFGVSDCSGTRSRTADLNVSTADVENQLQQIASQPAQAGMATAESQAAIQTFNQIMQQPDSSLYYAAAPSSMGPPQLVMNLDFQRLVPTGMTMAQPSLVYAYFVVALDTVNGGWQGALIIAGQQGANTSTTATQTSPTQGTATVDDGTGFNINNINFNFAADNAPGVDLAGSGGSVPLAAGTIDSDDGFQMDLNLNDAIPLHIQSYDVDDDGNLADVIQLDVYSLASDGSYNYLGKINLVQPD